MCLFVLVLVNVWSCVLAVVNVWSCVLVHFMFSVDLELSDFHSPIVSCCGDVLSFVFSPLLLFMQAPWSLG